MSRHPEQHPLAGQSVILADGPWAGQEYRIEDWWDRIAGKSWMNCDGNPACLEYAISGAGRTPIDDEVVYGKIGGLGHLVHVMDLSAEAQQEAA